MNEFLQQFLIESRELAQQATDALLALERAPQDKKPLDAAFRALHTLKGGAGIVDFVPMERAVHAAEDVLSAARAGRLTLKSALVGDCLACINQVLLWCDFIERSGELSAAGSDAEADKVVSRFETSVDGSKSADASGGLRLDAAIPVASGGLPALARDVLAAQLALVRETRSPRQFGHLASAAVTAANVLRSCGRLADAEHLRQLASGPDAAGMLAPLQQALTRLLGEEGADASPAVSAESQSSFLRSETSARTLRIDSERIDALVRLTGELTVAKNAMAHLAKLAYQEGNSLAAALKARHATFDHLIGELQRSVLALRVLPLRVVFQRFPRLLREMSESLGKSIELKIIGEDTEADKAIVEMLFEPLLHVVRNAINHGVESADVRSRHGKARAATIELRASRQNDQVLVEVTDDGAGIDLQRIRDVAAQRGVASAEVLGALTEAELADLVFAPGFSTATNVTALSGRGVGLDAVRSAVQRFGGRVSIHTRAGIGTTVRFMLPFSVMMTTVMSAEAGGQMFGVPLDTVVETISVPRRTLSAIGSARAVVVRDQTVPVLDLAQLLGEAGHARDSEDAIIVIVACAGQQCGLDVDAVGERLEIILKPLDGLLAGTPGIAGTTLLGDGRVLLVLDVGELLQ